MSILIKGLTFDDFVDEEDGRRWIRLTISDSGKAYFWENKRRLHIYKTTEVKDETEIQECENDD